MKLLSIAIAPVIIAVIYIYIRDKYEKEPWDLLFLGVIFGAVITAPIIKIENVVTSWMPVLGKIEEAFYMAFIVASLVEEAMKYIVLYFLSWRNRNFNEKFDGIVYAFFIALGFAGVENILYVFNPDFGGLDTAIGRSIISVPAHGIFGVSMGYSFAMAKFEPENRTRHMLLGFIVPLLLHGVFDFILLSEISVLMPLFWVFVLFLWVYALKRIKIHVESSPFKPTKEK